MAKFPQYEMKTSEPYTMQNYRRVSVLNGKTQWALAYAQGISDAIGAGAVLLVTEPNRGYDKFCVAYTIGTGCALLSMGDNQGTGLKAMLRREGLDVVILDIDHLLPHEVWDIESYMKEWAVKHSKLVYRVTTFGRTPEREVAYLEENGL